MCCSDKNVFIKHRQQNSMLASTLFIEYLLYTRPCSISFMHSLTFSFPVMWLPDYPCLMNEVSETLKRVSAQET